MNDASKKSSKAPVRKQVSLPADVAAEVNDYRYGQCIPSESEAIRRLIEAGLKSSRGNDAITSILAEKNPDADVISDWLRDRCVVSRSKKELTGDLFASFKEWLEATEEHPPWSHKRFTKFLLYSGFSSRRSTGGRRYIIGLSIAKSGE